MNSSSAIFTVSRFVRRPPTFSARASKRSSMARLVGICPSLVESYTLSYTDQAGLHRVARSSRPEGVAGSCREFQGVARSSRPEGVARSCREFQGVARSSEEEFQVQEVGESRV